MKKLSEGFAITAFALLFLFLLGSCIRWEWRECRQVGHGKLYCATHMGNRR